MLIRLTEQQKKDIAECDEMAGRDEDKDCFGCSCSVCIAVVQAHLPYQSSMEKAAPEMYEALKEIVDCEEHFYTEQGGIRLPKRLSPYAGPLSVIFTVARNTLKKAEEKG